MSFTSAIALSEHVHNIHGKYVIISILLIVNKELS